MSDKPPADPRQVTNRMLFLAMQHPLGLIERTRGDSWSEIRLTKRALLILSEDTAVDALDEAMRQIVFAKTPWFTADRVAAYSSFNVKPYLAAIKVLEACEGWTNIEEYNLFISRIHNESEISAVISDIQSYRLLSPLEQKELIGLVKERALTKKTNTNWEDMARHTFSLLSLGKAFERQENDLFLVGGRVSMAAAPSAAAASSPAPATSKAPRVPAPRIRPTLKLPNVLTDEDLLVPPSSKSANTGEDAEVLVGKIFSASGWDVRYYGQKRGYGFDLWVRKDKIAFLIEVKSSVGTMSTFTLTDMEYEAALAHRENFLVVVVESLDKHRTSMSLMVNPTDTIGFTKTNAVSYRSETNWRSHAQDCLAFVKP